MTIDMDASDVTLIRTRLGSIFNELSGVMLDLDVYPAFLLSDDRLRLVEVRTRAVELLDNWVAAEPATTYEIYARLPEFVQHPSVACSLLEAVMWSDLADPLIELFGHPEPDSRVFTVVPQLLPLLDESGLVVVAGLDARPWGLHIDQYALHYHQLMRRNFDSRIHYGLIESILRLSRKHNLTARLAVDERRVRFKDEYREFVEADYWYGPPFVDAGLDDLKVVGETYHGDPEGGTSSLNPFAGLSVRWTADADLKTVEIEEYVPAPDSSDGWVFARYLHAIRDTTKRTFIHCDGAVKAFDAANYPRSQQDFKSRGKGDNYRKLFRIDGEFPAAAWSEIASSWFRGNHLINEYLGGTSG
ncbi:hypothetical protein [Arthrobacter woluwensis]|uniref:hypothetical protein n=1 Tax=Arthrobacter woluwensis TaxID=156980 RepID=UPI0037FF3312